MEERPSTPALHEFPPLSRLHFFSPQNHGVIADYLAHLRAHEVGGVMHCFTETLEVARAALDMGFYIPFSGIVTFKNAVELKEVARQVPLERQLVETDAPYLAPVPYRGKRNEPAYGRHVAEHVAELREIPFEALTAATTTNFTRLFKVAL
jgi:TatD DNase family protein